MEPDQDASRPSSRIAATIATLTISFPPDERHSDDVRVRRTYATINACAFAHRQVVMRYERLTELLLQYDSTKDPIEQPPCRHAGGFTSTIKMDIGYPRGNEIVGLAWDLVDWLERFRKCFAAIVGIPDRQQLYRRFEDAFAQIARARNAAQHFDRELDKCATQSYLLMGAVSALYASPTGPYCRIVISTPFRSVYHKDVRGLGVVTLTELDAPIGGICFSLSDTTVDLSAVMCDIESLCADLAAYLSSTYKYDWHAL